jgi:uncharacterized membrane protein HdeD (DUF308 family)
MLGMAAQNWWALALRGVAALIFGILALVMPGLTLEALIVLFAVYALVDGVFAIVAGIRAAERHERWGMLALEGVASIVAGLIALFMPLAAAVGLLYLLAAWAVVTGIFEIAAAIQLRREIRGEWLLVLDGVLTVALGIAFMVMPGLGLLAIAWWIGIYALIFGVVMIGLAFRLRGKADTGIAMRRA